ncbi:MAG: AI-2E family transporter, partial [Blastococcus sp.]
MRLRLPGRSPGTTDDAPAGAPGSSPAAAPGATAEPGADVTAAPAPVEGRGPKLQRALRTLAIASAQFLLIAAAVVVLFWVLGKLWSILLPIVLGLLIATVLWPATRFLRKHRWPPALAASTVLVAAIAIFVGVIAAIAPSVADQVTQLSDSA